MNLAKGFRTAVVILDTRSFVSTTGDMLRDNLGGRRARPWASFTALARVLFLESDSESRQKRSQCFVQRGHDGRAQK